MCRHTQALDKKLYSEMSIICHVSRRDSNRQSTATHEDHLFYGDRVSTLCHSQTKVTLPCQMLNPIREEAAEASTKTCCDSQNRNTFGLHLARIPRRNIVYQAG